MSRIVALLYPIAQSRSALMRLILRTMIVRRAGIRKPDYVGSWHFTHIAYSTACPQPAEADLRPLDGNSSPDP